MTNDEKCQLLALVTELSMQVHGMRGRIDNLETAAKFLGESLTSMQEEDLNRDVRLSLLEGRLDGAEGGAS